MISICCFFLFAVFYAITKLYKCPNMQFNDFNKDNSTLLGGVLSIMVVLCHTSSIHSDMRYWGPLIVATFMFRSGYGLMNSYVIQGDTYLNNFFKKRFSKILYPLFFITTLHVLLMHYIHGYNIESFCTGLKHGRVPIGATWYLFTSLFFYVAFYLSAKYSKSFRKLITLMGAFSMLYFVVIASLGTFWRYWLSPSFIMMAGMLFYHYEKRLKSFITEYRFQSIVYCLFLVVFCFMCVKVCWLSSFVTYAIFPIAVIVIIYYVGMPKGKITIFLGSLSYEIYLIHDCIIALLLPLKLYHTLYLILVFGMTIPLAVLLQKLNTHVLYKL